MVGACEFTSLSSSQKLLMNKQQLQQLLDHSFFWGFIVFETHGGNQVNEKAVAKLTKLGIFLYDDAVGERCRRNYLSNQLQILSPGILAMLRNV